jgi:hypothetical protein
MRARVRCCDAVGAEQLRTNGSAAVDNAVAKALAPFPNVQVQTRAQFEQAQVSSVNQVLGLIAASWPARRAAKLDVLAAIAAE